MHVLFHASFLNAPSSEMQVRAQTFVDVVDGDVNGLLEAAKHYGESWYQRDGAGAFFMLARKWDRIEKKMKDEGYKSILEVLKADRRAEGLIDDIRDLRRYLVLIEAKLMELGFQWREVEKGDKVAVGGDLHKRELAVYNCSHDGCPNVVTAFGLACEQHKPAIPPPLSEEHGCDSAFLAGGPFGGTIVTLPVNEKMWTSVMEERGEKRFAHVYRWMSVEDFWMTARGRLPRFSYAGEKEMQP